MSCDPLLFAVAVVLLQESAIDFSEQTDQRLRLRPY